MTSFADSLLLPPHPPFTVPHRLAMGLAVLGAGEPWILLDDDWSADLREKRRLLAERRDQVFVEQPASRAAQRELLVLLTRTLASRHPERFALGDGRIRLASSGEELSFDDPERPPLETAALLVQEDLCLMERAEGAWRLSAGAVCFPSLWDLPSKLGLSLTAIHDPVPGYRRELAASADRFFDRMAPERIYGRANWQLVDDPALFQPSGHHRRDRNRAVTSRNAGDTVWLRRERQTLRRLPETDAVVFTIRVLRTPLGALAAHPAAAACLRAAVQSVEPETAVYKSVPRIREAVLAWLGAVEEGRAPRGGAARGTFRAMAKTPERIVADGVGRLPVFSHASVAGDLIFVSGTLGTKPGGFELVEGGAGPETRQTLENIATILEAAGAGLPDVVKMSVFVANMEDFPAMNAAYREFFPDEPPARITVGGVQLALGAAVEIEAIAVRRQA